MILLETRTIAFQTGTILPETGMMPFQTETMAFQTGTILLETGMMASQIGRMPFFTKMVKLCGKSLLLEVEKK
ncbi:MAG: hypothetical protein KME43_25960 [Myxacorys chilensis ATA2-1-KO14]|jgi:hypothetical protein|nr:hypothetical protein [Myxacorys chilensis ATA2-1-KO14]